MAFRWFMAGALGLLILRAEEAGPSSPREQAAAALKAGNLTNALSIITDAIRADPKDPRLWNFRAQLRSLSGDSSGAITDLSEGIRRSPESGFLHQERATERFKIGQLAEAVGDFDRANELAPEIAPYNWQRGIALYYAKRYGDGRKQFELHRTVNPNDVENAVWHFLCVARAEGTNAAHRAFMPIQSDDRIPMVEIHELFGGEGTVEDVWEAATNVTGSAEEQRQARFHAQLYLGLYADVMGRSDEAREHLREAARLAAPRDFMGHVARLHLARLGNPPASAPP